MRTTNPLCRPLSLVLLGTIALTSCSAAPTSKAPTAQAPRTESAAKQQPTAPQLIRKADLALDVKESGPIVKKIRTLIAAAQGDSISLEEQGQAGDTRRASLTVRVPQDKLASILQTSPHNLRQLLRTIQNRQPPRILRHHPQSSTIA